MNPRRLSSIIQGIFISIFIIFKTILISIHNFKEFLSGIRTTIISFIISNNSEALLIVTQGVTKGKYWKSQREDKILSKKYFRSSKRIYY